MHIEISTRHGSLTPGQLAHLREKAEKLPKYFGRLMEIEVAVDQGKHSWNIEILCSAEHKHDFVAHEEAPTPEAAMDQCVHKIENQLRKYKERLQNHKGDVALADAAAEAEEADAAASESEATSEAELSDPPSSV
ncbi:ribosome-associated translation inhibitor RaiA [Isosphaeraceae bacterium EP7]